MSKRGRAVAAREYIRSARENTKKAKDILEDLGDKDAVEKAERAEEKTFEILEYLDERLND